MKAEVLLSFEFDSVMFNKIIGVTDSTEMD